jgi:excisionase family DNA binding protein
VGRYRLPLSAEYRELIPLSEAARIGLCSRDTIRKAVDAGKLPGVRATDGTRYVTDRAALEAFSRRRADGARP